MKIPAPSGPLFSAGSWSDTVKGTESGGAAGVFFVEIPDLLLNRLEHPRLAAFATDTEDSAELPIEFHDTDGGRADIFHAVQVGIEAFGETAQAEGL